MVTISPTMHIFRRRWQEPSIWLIARQNVGIALTCRTPWVEEYIVPYILGIKFRQWNKESNSCAYRMSHLTNKKKQQEFKYPCSTDHPKVKYTSWRHNFIQQMANKWTTSPVILLSAAENSSTCCLWSHTLCIFDGGDQNSPLGYRKPKCRKPSFVEHLELTNI